MPPDAPGTLTDQQSIDAIAHMLALSEMPAGDKELPVDLKVLSVILIEAKPKQEKAWTVITGWAPALREIRHPLLVTEFEIHSTFARVTMCGSERNASYRSGYWLSAVLGLVSLFVDNALIPVSGEES